MAKLTLVVEGAPGRETVFRPAGGLFRVGWCGPWRCPPPRIGGAGPQRRHPAMILRHAGDAGWSSPRPWSTHLERRCRGHPRCRRMPRRSRCRWHRPDDDVVVVVPMERLKTPPQVTRASVGGPRSFHNESGKVGPEELLDTGDSSRSWCDRRRSWSRWCRRPAGSKGSTTRMSPAPVAVQLRRRGAGPGEPGAGERGGQRIGDGDAGGVGGAGVGHRDRSSSNTSTPGRSPTSSPPSRSGTRTSPSSSATPDHWPRVDLPHWDAELEEDRRL